MKSNYDKKKSPKRKLFYTDSQGFYIVTLLAIYRGLHELYGFGPERLNRITDFLPKFFQREDLSTIAEELMYWADKHGIRY